MMYLPRSSSHSVNLAHETQLTFSARFRPAIPCRAEGLLPEWLVAVLRPIAALPLVEFEAPEPGGSAWRVGNGFVDGTNIPSFKEDVIAFRIFGVGIAFQDQHRSREILERTMSL